MNYKYLFFNDYSEGAHPTILQALQQTNLVQEAGYGEDSICKNAAKLIREKIENSNADIHFVSGGTQANLIVLSSLLKPYESVIAAGTGHISVHEAGAIEATGHKINVIPTKNGKITADQVQTVCDEHSDEHMVKPRVVFISNSTEVGTIYLKKDLQDLSAVCKKNSLYLYLDGARLGSALMSDGFDMSLTEMSSFVDVFYIG